MNTEVQPNIEEVIGAIVGPARSLSGPGEDSSRLHSPNRWGVWDDWKILRRNGSLSVKETSPAR